MARARVIKPAFYGDIALSEVSRDARLLYIGLWQLMDRRGLMEYHPKLVKRDIFPYDDDATASSIEKWIAELVTIRRLRIVRFDGKRYLYCPYLPKHQHFHVNETPNALIPEAVISAPEEPGPGTVPAPCEPGANTSDTDTDTEANTKTEAEADSERARARGTGPPPLPVHIADLLVRALPDASIDGRLALWRAYPDGAFLGEEIPKCEAQWALDDERRKQGAKALYLRRWLDNATKDRARHVRAGPRGEDRPISELLKERDGRGVA